MLISHATAGMAAAVAFIFSESESLLEPCPALTPTVPAVFLAGYLTVEVVIFTYVGELFP